MFAIFFHFFQLVLDDDSLVNKMLKIWVVGVEQLELDLVIESLEKRIQLLLISVDLMQGVVRQLSELGDLLIHRHGPQFQILKLFLLQLDHSLGNMMCTESSSKFWPVDALGLLVGFHISIPPIGCRTIELVRG